MKLPLFFVLWFHSVSWAGWSGWSGGGSCGTKQHIRALPHATVPGCAQSFGQRSDWHRAVPLSRKRQRLRVQSMVGAPHEAAPDVLWGRFLKGREAGYLEELVHIWILLLLIFLPIFPRFFSSLISHSSLHPLPYSPLGWALILVPVPLLLCLPRCVSPAPDPEHQPLCLEAGQRGQRAVGEAHGPLCGPAPPH